MHPRPTPTRVPRCGPRGRLRCFSLKYSRYSRSSRLASEAPRPSRCDARLSPRAAGAFMTEGSTGETVFVESAARLHFGVLDLRGSFGRWFGGIGAAAPAPLLLVSASPADTLEVEGAHADRAN